MDDRHLNMKSRTLYLLGGNIEKSSWSWYGEEFLKSLKVQMQKGKFNSLTTIKLGTFVHPRTAPGSVTYKGEVSECLKHLHKFARSRQLSGTVGYRLEQRYWEEEMVLLCAHQICTNENLSQFQELASTWRSRNPTRPGAGGSVNWYTRFRNQKGEPTRVSLSSDTGQSVVFVPENCSANEQRDHSPHPVLRRWPREGRHERTGHCAFVHMTHAYRVMASPSVGDKATRRSCMSAPVSA